MVLRSSSLCHHYFIPCIGRNHWDNSREKKEMEKKDKVGLAAVGFLGLTCATLDFATEASKIKLERSYPGNICVVKHGSFSAPYLEASLAAIILGIAHILINILTRRCSFFRKSPRPQSATLLFLGCLSLWTFIGAELYQLVHLYNFAYKCTVGRRGTWAGAAILSLASVIIGMAYTYYHLLLAAKNSNVPQIEIAMGQRIPSIVTQDPVFVHEDTFMRRQFP